MSNWTTESWQPADCPCALHHMFLEGPDAPPVNVSNLNLALYCSPEQATNIRKAKHDFRMSHFMDKGDMKELLSERKWWRRRRAYPYTEVVCPAHAGMSGHAWYQALVDESIRRQLSYNIITNLQPSFVPDSGSDRTIVDLKFEWEGTKDSRILYIYLTTDEIVSMPELSTMLDIQFGPGKVRLKNLLALDEGLVADLLAL